LKPKSAVESIVMHLLVRVRACKGPFWEAYLSLSSFT